MKRTEVELAAVVRWKELTKTVLPARAREERWPIRLDHCFKRITLDHAFEDAWYRHLPKPAERHLAGDALTRAVACGEQILSGGRPVLEVRNRESLRLRGKAKAQ